MYHLLKTLTNPNLAVTVKRDRRDGERSKTCDTFLTLFDYKCILVIKSQRGILKYKCISNVYLSIQGSLHSIEVSISVTFHSIPMRATMIHKDILLGTEGQNGTFFPLLWKPIDRQRTLEDVIVWECAHWHGKCPFCNCKGPEVSQNYYLTNEVALTMVKTTTNTLSLTLFLQ